MRNRMIAFWILLAISLLILTGVSADTLDLPASLTVIEEEAFYGDQSLDKVVLPEGIRRIEKLAFASSSLREINLPDSLSNIADDAFDPGKGIMIITKKESEWYEWAKDKGFLIKEEDYGETSASDFVFIQTGENTCSVYQYLGISPDVVIPICDDDGKIVTGIEEFAFASQALNSQLHSVRIPDGVNTIGQFAFGFPNGETILYANLNTGASRALSKTGYRFREKGMCYDMQYSFDDTDDISGLIVKSIDETVAECNIMEGVTEIGEYVCGSNNAVQRLILPDSLRKIASHAFGTCFNLSEVEVPDCVEEIGYGAFPEYTSGGKLIIYANVDSDAAKALGKADKGFRTKGKPYDLQYIYEDEEIIDLALISADKGVSDVIVTEDVSFVSEEAFSSSDVQSIIFPQTLKRIGSNAFSGCQDLTRIEGLDNVTAIGNSAFLDCTSLFHISDLSNLESIDGSLGYQNDAESAELADQFRYYAEYYDEYSYFIRNRKIYVKEGSTGARTLSMAGYNFSIVGTKYTQRYQFEGNSIVGKILTHVDLNSTRCTIPNGITVIANTAFSGCDALREITYPQSVERIEENTYQDINPDQHGDYKVHNYAYIGSRTANLLSHAGSTFTVPETNCYLKYYGDNWNEDGQYYEDGVLSVISFDSDITEVEIPNGVEEIAATTGTKNSILKHISIPATVKEISWMAFKNWDGIEELVIPDTITACMSFGDMEGLKRIIIPGNFTSYPVYGDVLGAVKSLESVYVSKNSNSLALYKLWRYEEGTGNLPNLFIPSSVTSIDHFTGADSNNPFEHVDKIYCPKESYAWNLASGFTENAEKLIEWNETYFTQSDGDNSDTNNPVITKIVFDAQTITVGTPLGFSLETKNTDYVQLIVDGEYYDTIYTDNAGKVSALRIITQAGDREVAFFAGAIGKKGSISKTTTIHVVSSGSLATPETEWARTIYYGENLKLNWKDVPNAKGYILYINHPNGQILQITPTAYDDNYSRDDENTYLFPASTFNMAGKWSVRLMAYGEGYSQSSKLCEFEVLDSYKPWTGWPQDEKVNTYASAYTKSVNGFVDYLDPVTVLDEKDGRYYIEMILTAGGKAKRWVNMTDIGLEQYSPEVTVSGSYYYEDNGKLIISVKTNLVGALAGVDQISGEEIIRTSKAHQYSTYRKTFNFRLDPVNSLTSFTIWAEDYNGNHEERTLTVDKKTTPEPTSEPTPAPTPTPGGTQTAIPQPTVTTAPNPTITSTPIPAAEPTSQTNGCSYQPNSQHANLPVILKDCHIVADKDGNIYIENGICQECGKEIKTTGKPSCSIGFTYKNSLFNWHYENDDSDLPSDTYSLETIRAKTLTFKHDLIITKNTNLQGVELIVEGELTVKAKLLNVKSIECNGLTVETNGKIQDLAGNVKVNGGNVTIEKGGKVDIGNHSLIASNLKINVSGMLNAKEVQARKITINKSASTNISSLSGEEIIFKTPDSGEYTMNRSGEIKVSSSLKVEGKLFQFDGTVYVISGIVKMDNQGANYIGKLVFQQPLLSKNSKGKLDISNDLRANDVYAKQKEYKPVDINTYAWICNDVLGQLETKLQKYITDNSGTYKLVKAAKNYVNTFKDATGSITREKCTSLVQEAWGVSGGTFEKPAGLKSYKTAAIYSTSGNASAVTNRDEYIDAIAYGLMQEMFCETSFSKLKGKVYTIDFNKIEAADYPFYYGGEKWCLHVSETSLVVKIKIVEAGDNGSAEARISWIRGTVYGNNHAVVNFEFFPDDLERTAAALCAAGMGEAAETLKCIVLDVFNDATSLANECFDIENSIQNAVGRGMKDVFSQASYRLNMPYSKIAYSDELLSGIMDDMLEYQDIFDLYSDMLDLVTDLQSNMIDVSK